MTDQAADTGAAASSLADAIRARLRRAPRDTLSRWDVPRQALLARHLGFGPVPPIPVVHVIGDSHVLFFCGTSGLSKVRFRRFGLIRPDYLSRGVELLPCFRVFHLGPATAWQAFEFGSTTRGREKLESLLRRDVGRDQSVLLSYGEIDCRCHIPRAVLAGAPMAQAVEQTVARFMRLPLDLQARGLRAAVWGPPAVTAQPEALKDPQHPLPEVGPLELRREITRAYMQQLQTSCAAAGIPCVCLADQFIDASEPAMAQGQIDGCHLAAHMMPIALARLQASGVLIIQRALARNPATLRDGRLNMS